MPVQVPYSTQPYVVQVSLVQHLRAWVLFKCCYLYIVCQFNLPSEVEDGWVVAGSTATLSVKKEHRSQIKKGTYIAFTLTITPSSPNLSEKELSFPVEVRLRIRKAKELGFEHAVRWVLLTVEYAGRCQLLMAARQPGADARWC